MGLTKTKSWDVIYVATDPVHSDVQSPSITVH